jgi:integrase
MPRLKPDPKGNYRARKRIPNDVREEYGRQHGQCHEAKLFIAAGTGAHAAKQRYGEWLAEVEARIIAIRAARDGTGLNLTAIQARKLAGDWYEWFTARHVNASREDLEGRRDAIHEAFKSSVSEEEFERLHAEELWAMEDVREALRPVLADIGETAQFLALQQGALTRDARNLFLDFLYDDLAAALRRLLRLSEGDYSPDKYPERFPKSAEGPDSGVTPWQLFEKWIAERKPADGTVGGWRYVFQELGEHFKDRSAASITADEATAWIKGLVTAGRGAGTVKTTWLSAINTVFRWALEQKHGARNPFAGVKVVVPKKKKLRERVFLPQEAMTILRAALAITDTTRPIDATKRWVPWLCAYSGARVSEMTQLRGMDVLERDGIHALHITPDAGTVKDSEARVVPIHQDLIKQGFLEFVAARGKGPLFYKPDTSAASTDPTKPKKARYAQASKQLAAWVRSLGVTDQNIMPNHAWRHTFKQIADRARISERMSDYITGHAHKSAGARYGAPTLGDMAEALKEFPPYAL